MSSQNTNNGSKGPGMDDRIAEYKYARRESRLKLYPILTEFYEQFLYLKAHEEEQDKFLGRCIREGVTIEAGARPRRNPCPARAETISRGKRADTRALFRKRICRVFERSS